MEFLENKTGEIKAWGFLLSITEIVNSVQQIGTGIPLIVNNYIFGLIWGIDFIYLFNLHGKDGNGKLSSSCTTVLLKFDTLHSLENYKRSVYYSAYPMILYFQLEFTKIHCTVNVYYKRSDCQQNDIFKSSKFLYLQKIKYLENGT